MPSLALAGHWVRSAAVVWRRLPDGVLLFPPDAAAPFAVTGPGAALWDLLAESHTFDAIVALLAERYATDVDTVRADIEPIVDHLRATGAVVVDAHP